MEDIEVNDIPRPSLVFSMKDEEVFDNQLKVFDHQPFDNASSSADINKEEADADEYYDDEEDEPSYIDEK